MARPGQLSGTRAEQLFGNFRGACAVPLPSLASSRPVASHVLPAGAPMVLCSMGVSRKLARKRAPKTTIVARARAGCADLDADSPGRHGAPRLISNPENHENAGVLKNAMSVDALWWALPSRRPVDLPLGEALRRHNAVGLQRGRTILARQPVHCEGRLVAVL